MSKRKKNSSFLYKKETIGLIAIFFSVLLAFCFIQFDFHHIEKNALGGIGYYVALPFVAFFGVCSLLLFLFSTYVGTLLFTKQKLPEPLTFFFFTLFFLSTLSLCATVNFLFPDLAHLINYKLYSQNIVSQSPYPYIEVRNYLGGLVGDRIVRFGFFPLMGAKNSLGVLSLLTLVNLSFLFHIDPIQLLIKTGVKIVSICKTILVETATALKSLFKPKKKMGQIEKKLVRSNLFKEKKPIIRTKRTVMKKPLLPKKTSSWSFPSLNFFKNPLNQDNPMLKRDLMLLGQTLEKTLLSFSIEASVGSIHCGPRIASFEVIPKAGVKVQKIKALEHDIALNLKAKSTRIIAPIPGKAAVGIEIPSPHPQEVSFKEILQNYQARPTKHHIPLILGKDAMGGDLTADLAKMPHLLIAGATGSGKSVCMNTIILSLLMNASPDEVKLLMIDPKKVELTGYSKLPHMIAPVITEVHGATAALNWLVKEMLYRYEVLKHLRLRNIHSFNSRKVHPQQEAELPIKIPEKMPFFVAIIDEFADLILASSSDIETPIARIAQMARAVGIHMILATQRPSREVITGLIKANFPTRIAFKVASKINSQIIIDETGAETLLGNGDMLFLPPASSNLVRAQGAYISDEEIMNVVQHFENTAPTNYLIESFDSPSLSLEEEDTPKDALYNEARMVVIGTGNASTTFLQRKLKIGYARAASLMDELELRGVVSSQEGSKARRVLYKDE